MTSVPKFSHIAGTGSALPPLRLTNADMVAKLAARGVETSDAWIVERTGIRARHFAEPDVASSDLGTEAARRAMDQSSGHYLPMDQHRVLGNGITAWPGCLVELGLGRLADFHRTVHAQSAR